MFNFNLPLRIFQSILAIIALGVNGYGIHLHPLPLPKFPITLPQKNQS